MDTPTLNAFEDYHPTLAVTITDLAGTKKVLNECRVKLCANDVVFLPQQSDVASSLPKQYIISITRHECSNKKGIQIQCRAAPQMNIVHAEVTFSSPSAALALLHSMDHLWPDVRMDYCECAAALLATCTRAKSDQVDRAVWPWALITLVEWEPYGGRHEIACVETDVVATDDCFVFHLKGMETRPAVPANLAGMPPAYVAKYMAQQAKVELKPLPNLYVRRCEIVEPPVAVIQPFVGTKLRLSSSKYSHIIIEIMNKSDLYGFMSTMLFPWGQQISLKRQHSATISAEMKTARASLDRSMDLRTANSSFSNSFRETTADTARSISDHTLRTLITPELNDAIVPPPVKRARTVTDFFTISTTGVVLTAANGRKAQIQLTNVGADRAVFRLRFNDRYRHQNMGKHHFNTAKAFVEGGKTVELRISKDPKDQGGTGYYSLDFARAPADFTDAAEAIAKVHMAGRHDFTVAET